MFTIHKNFILRNEGAAKLLSRIIVSYSSEVLMVICMSNSKRNFFYSLLNMAPSAQIYCDRSQFNLTALFVYMAKNPHQVFSVP
jgi:hypothetical protein